LALLTLPLSSKCISCPEIVGWSLEEVEEIFSQGHAFAAWKIGKDVGKKTLKEVVEKPKDLEVTLKF
jgi:hypothetical protein